MLDRRTLTAALSLMAALPMPAHADDDDWQSMLANAVADKDPLVLGHVIPPPGAAVWEEAAAVLHSAPRGPTPYHIAQWMITSVPPHFQMAWPEPDPAHPTYANPLILLFFLSTKTKPAGDTTAWCAAFTNWCLARSGVPGTHAASSQSFLDWGRPVWKSSDGGLPIDARPGDIAVFTLLSNPSHGHVGFFQGISKGQPNHIDVLGGNQIVSHHQHVIDVKSLRTDSNLRLAAVRTKRGLRDAA